MVSESPPILPMANTLTSHSNIFTLHEIDEIWNASHLHNVPRMLTRTTHNVCKAPSDLQLQCIELFGSCSRRKEVLTSNREHQMCPKDLDSCCIFPRSMPDTPHHHFWAHCQSLPTQYASILAQRLKSPTHRHALKTTRTERSEWCRKEHSWDRAYTEMPHNSRDIPHDDSTVSTGVYIMYIMSRWYWCGLMMEWCEGNNCESHALNAIRNHKDP